MQVFSVVDLLFSVCKISFSIRAVGRHERNNLLFMSDRFYLQLEFIGFKNGFVFSRDIRLDLELFILLETFGWSQIPTCYTLLQDCGLEMICLGDFRVILHGFVRGNQNNT